MNTYPIDTQNINNKCMARLKSNILKQCSRNKKLNCDFCGLHIKSTSIIRIDEPIPDRCSTIPLRSSLPGKKTNNIRSIPCPPPRICITYDDLKQNKFNIKKFLYRNILFSLQEASLPNLKNKQQNFDQLLKYLTIQNRTKNIYTLNMNKLLVISKLIRGYFIRKYNILKGPGFLNNKIINNKTDFLNFVDIDTIKYNNLITYKDEQNFVYGFHIHSLLEYIKELKLQDNKAFTIINPYTRKPFSDIFIKKLYTLEKYNNKNKKKLHVDNADNADNMNNVNNVNNVDTVNTVNNVNSSNSNIIDILEKKYKNVPSDLKIKRLCVDIFQRMDDLELYTQAMWFLNLSLFKLKQLYFYIEDIWHYRAGLTLQMRKKYVFKGKAFSWPYTYIKSIVDKKLLQKILLYEFAKFAYQGKTKEDCITASYWILMGLTMVSPEAALGCPALVQSNY